MDWQPIDTAPKDGTVIHVRRIYQRREIYDGPARWATLAPAAPCLKGMGPDPLNRMSSADYEQERRGLATMAKTEAWLASDRMYYVPMPTHWMPAP